MLIYQCAMFHRKLTFSRGYDVLNYNYPCDIPIYISIQCSHHIARWKYSFKIQTSSKEHTHGHKSSQSFHHFHGSCFLAIPKFGSCLWQWVNPTLYHIISYPHTIFMLTIVYTFYPILPILLKILIMKAFF